MRTNFTFPMVQTPTHQNDAVLNTTSSTFSKDFVDEPCERDVIAEIGHDFVLPRRSSLSFTIEHYYLMAEKVFISFLKLYQMYSSLVVHNDSSSDYVGKKAFVLGKRLLIFLQDVLPFHIHYYTDFKGKDTLVTISHQVDEYLLELNSLTKSEKFDSDDEEEMLFYNNVVDARNDNDSPSRHRFSSSRHEFDCYTRSKNEDSFGDLGLEADIVQDQICESIGDEDTNVKHMEDCESKASTSYSMNWDECDECDECDDTDGIVDHTFILTKLNIEHGNTEKIKAIEKSCNNDHHLVGEVKSVSQKVQFKKLISHWKAQERKWNCRQAI